MLTYLRKTFSRVLTKNYCVLWALFHYCIIQCTIESIFFTWPKLRLPTTKTSKLKNLIQLIIRKFNKVLFTCKWWHDLVLFYIFGHHGILSIVSAISWSFDLMRSIYYAIYAILLICIFFLCGEGSTDSVNRQLLSRQNAKRDSTKKVP